MLNAIYAVWILFWFVISLKCMVDDYKRDKKSGNVPVRLGDFVFEYILPAAIVNVIIGFGAVWAVAKFISWVA